MKCAEPVCERRAEVSIHCDAGLIVLACLSCGIRLALGLRGCMRLLDGTRRPVIVAGNDASPYGDVK